MWWEQREEEEKKTLVRTFHLRSSAANRTYVFMSQDKQPCHGGRSPKLMMSSDSLQQNPLLKQNERGREGGKCGGSLGPARGDGVEEEEQEDRLERRRRRHDPSPRPKKPPQSEAQRPFGRFLCQILPFATIISLYTEKRAHFLFTPSLLPEYCF